MWTFILIVTILLGIKIACRIFGGLILIAAALTDNLDEIEESVFYIVFGAVKLVISIPLFIWGLFLLF